MLSVSPLFARRTSLSAPPIRPTVSQADAAALTEANMARVVDGYLYDDKGQRFKMGLVTGASVGLAALASATIGAFLPASTAVGLGAAALGAVTGVASAVYCFSRYVDDHQPLSKGASGRGIGHMVDLAGMGAFTLGVVGGFGTLLTVGATMDGGLGVGVLTALGVAMTAGMAGGAVREGQSRRAVHDLDKFERTLDAATAVEGMVLRNAEAADKAVTPAGRVTAEDDYVIVGGVKIKKEKSRE